MKPKTNIITEATRLISSIRFKIKIINYNTSKHICFNLSKNTVHKLLVIKYDTELKENMN